MSRKGRRSSSKNCYHIVLRGRDTVRLFQNDQNKRDFEYVMDSKAEELTNFHITHSYIGTNHVHVLLFGTQMQVTTFCKKVSNSYAWLYKQRYRQEGGVFQGRFLSQPIESKWQYDQIAQYIQTHQYNQSWRMNSECHRKTWQQDLVQLPIIIDICDDLQKQYATLLIRLMRKKKQETKILSIAQLLQEEHLWHDIQEEAKRYLGVRKNFDFLREQLLHQKKIA